MYAIISFLVVQASTVTNTIVITPNEAILASSVVQVGSIPKEALKRQITANNATSSDHLGGNQEYFDALWAKYPILKRIAACESGGGVKNPPRHYDNSGNVILGWYNKKDTGIFQINLTAHAGELKKLGLDAFDPIDNAKFAEILYKRNGTRDWDASRKCWLDLQMLANKNRPLMEGGRLVDEPWPWSDAQQVNTFRNPYAYL